MRVKTLGSIAAIGALVAIGFAAPASATPVLADSYPSWAEVQAAQGNAQAANAEYTKISNIVAQLQSAADAAASVQLQKQAAYTLAAQQLDTATKTADGLAAKAADAQQQSKQADARYGQLVSQLYLTGGSNVTVQLLLDKGDKSSLLDKLGAMSQLTEHSAQLHSFAVSKANEADAYSEQATKAEAIRKQLSDDAATKLQAAQAAEASAQQALQTQQKESSVLYQQAAALQNTAVSVQQQYYAGVQYAANQAAKQAAAGQGGGDPDLGIIAKGLTPNPAAAQAYARGAVANNGWGSDQFNCLVSLWTIESGWRLNAYNTSSGAYGIPQALPGEKMATAGGDWMTNADTQINWGLGYIKNRYGTPCAALAFEKSHVPYWY